MGRNTHFKENSFSNFKANCNRMIKKLWKISFAADGN